MTIKLQQNDDTIVSLPLVSSNKSSRSSLSSIANEQQQDYNDNSSSTTGDFVLYSERHGSTVIVSCCSELEFLDLETQLIGTSLSTNKNLPLCEKDGCDDDLLGPQEEDSFDNFFKEVEDDDDSSISSYSCSEGSFQKKVHFADTLVSEVWTRPRTPSEECKTLFYSYEDTQRFRHEYRLERKMQQQVNIDPALVSVNNINNNVDNNEVSEDVNNRSNNIEEKLRGRHSISRVVVLHNNTLETFYDEPQDMSKQSKSNFRSGMFKQGQSNESSDDFFDNDSFWSGSITWF